MRAYPKADFDLKEIRISFRSVFTCMANCPISLSSLELMRFKNKLSEMMLDGINLVGDKGFEGRQRLFFEFSVEMRHKQFRKPKDRLATR